MNIGADVQQPLDLGGGAMGVFNASSDGRMFCVAKRGAEPGKLQDGLVWACGEGQANCSDIQEGQPCFEPDNLESHASYAYNNYYARDWVVGGTCDFNGTATITQNDPSMDSWIFIYCC
ncbi:hypothetical protein AMTR_s00217p00027050 [Amborella trichopoda]|uniref:X8 domain-containing protein n=1 Tax=Amborella trichopoda TaxID=13333 RepID=W1NTI0_AMBTC|nr:hypothetical protein AMTR_s00217p00027050 [Amborella trichopoda]